MDKTTRILIVSADRNLREVLTFCFDGWGYEVFVLDPPLNDVNAIKKISPSVVVMDVETAHKPQLHACQLLKDDFLTAFIPIITIINKRQLRQQLLDIRQGVDDYLIKPPDPLDLRIRIEMALKRSAYSFHTNALTGLPGARIIEEHIRERLAQRQFFSFCYVDIDNFKCFNDVYGYLKGDRVIMQVAYMLYTCVKKYGNPGDFIGHIGGDDFVFVSTPDRYEAVCEQFIDLFERVTPCHYTPADRLRGHVIAHDRSHALKKIPLMSVSIAVVNKTDAYSCKSLVEVSDRVAEIKGYLKVIPGSTYMADRRNSVLENNKHPRVFKYEQHPGLKPLGQILLEQKRVTQEQLDEALKVNWKRGVPLGEVLKEQGVLAEPELAEALGVQQLCAAKKLASVN